MVLVDPHWIPSSMIKGKDQRDYYYFMALGHYKLEVGGVWRCVIGGV